MNESFVEGLFSSLNQSNVDYVVLRGYEELPKTYTNDIDFSVRDEEMLKEFLIILRTCTDSAGGELIRDKVRPGLLKLKVKTGESVVLIDVFFSFTFIGLSYVNSEIVHLDTKRTKNSIRYPSSDVEYSLSLIKEIFHNSRVRSDKIDYLRELSVFSSFQSVLGTNISIDLLQSIEKSLIKSDRQYYFQESRKIRSSFYRKRLKQQGVISFFFDILKFLYIKYLGQGFYDYLIFPEINSKH